MASRPQNTDLLVFVDARSKRQIPREPRALEPALPTSMMNAKNPTTNDRTAESGLFDLGAHPNQDRPKRPLRRKRRFTMGGPDRPPNETADAPSGNDISINTSGYSGQERSSVTISVSTEDWAKLDPGRNAPQPGLHPSSAADSGRIPRKPNSTTILKRHEVRGSRSQSPKASYPPTSWKISSRDHFAASASASASASAEEGFSNTLHKDSDARAFANPLEIPNLKALPLTISSTRTGALSESSSPRLFPSGIQASSSEAIRETSSATCLIAHPTGPSSRESSSLPTRRIYIRSHRRTNKAVSSSSICTPTGTSPTPEDDNADNEPCSIPHCLPAEPTLPDPEVVYAHKYHYTTCPHTSPPASRPLNAQPTLAGYDEGLLAYPPFHLQTWGSRCLMAPPNIYIIEGSCPECDLASRRKAESEILDKYTDTLDNLSLQIHLLSQDVEPDFPTAIKSAIRANTASALMFSHSNRDRGFDWTTRVSAHPTITPETTQTILEIERHLDHVIEQRDREVKLIWKGYTARWGPATVGIHRENHTLKKTRSRAPSTSERIDLTEQDTTSSTSIIASTAEAGTDRPSTMTSMSATSTHMTKTRSSSIRSQRSSQGTGTGAQTYMSVGNGPKDRYSDGTHDVNVPSSVDGVRNGGRMIVDWIRPDLDSDGRPRTRSRSQSQNQNQSRNHSRSQSQNRGHETRSLDIW
ncbi:uncharacterized protein Z518_07928 [Rhinocladiella mackenziei CBS 650.93]|uniref:Uncharacterized protein n=1 Tax=Rhinocladiella mackenziei CBS 650.93 TaxID=1442369 RepID=A0A0D2I817_9EURO|nr:uncharacterized protein Z518_07928 [Rhinocladiella mackenziei CBS 650.93]KIX01989.1 hypothetical protein Z518_07928 [Rhinocladiella mackenziei CBS 650.93]